MTLVYIFEIRKDEIVKQPFYIFLMNLADDTKTFVYLR